MKPDLIALIIIMSLISTATADFWASTVGTDSSSWSIYRQSGNINCNLSSSIEGKIAPIDSHGRVLSPYQSRYADIGENDVKLRERTSALEGKYKSEDNIRLWSNIANSVNIYYFKPFGSDIFSFSYYEQWPALLTTSRTLEYVGQQINDRDFQGNNRDFVGSNLLYNHELSEELRAVMWLDRMNATVLATNDSIIQAEFMPTKYLGYLIRANTTGIADLRFRHAGSQYDVKRRDYPAVDEGDERYYGTYTLARKIEMRSVFENKNNTAIDEWLPCCNGGWSYMRSEDPQGHSANGFFNCSC
jgi:hypothetical protein